jgi:Yip1-like protein
MVDTTAQPAPQPGLLTRMFGVLTSPRETFAAVAARPRWLGVMAITLAITATCQYVIFSSPDIQDAMIAQATRNPNVSDAQVAATEQFIPRLPAIFAGATLFLGPVFTAIIGGILLLIFSTLMGGAATFKQVYSVVAHSGVVSMLSGLLSAGLIMIGAPPTGPNPPGANLGIFVPMLEETSFVTQFLSAIDLVLVWWVVTLSIGLAVLYKRRTFGIAATLLCIYVLFALVIGYARSGS